MNLEERIYNGDRAREVLENEAFVGAFAAIEKECTDKWKATSALNAADREKLWLMLQMLYKLQEVMQGMLSDGKMAMEELEYQRKQQQRNSQSMMERARGWLSSVA